MTTWLVVGLGNPGPGYARNRHNVGFMVVDEIARGAATTFAAPRGMRAEVAETRIGVTGSGASGTAGFGALGVADKVLLVKPRTFMNDSGVAVAKLAAFHKIPPDHVVVIHDELDIDSGQLRIKQGGGDNGHNGLKSIRAHLHTGDFLRIRFGIGRPPGRMTVHDWVLSDHPATERTDLAIEVDRAADAVASLLTEGLVATQNRFNS